MEKMVSMRLDSELIKNAKRRALDLDLYLTGYIEALIKSDLELVNNQLSNKPTTAQVVGETTKSA